MNEAIQSEELAKADLAEHDRLVALRSPWEDTWREVDARFPNGAGGFDRTTPGQIRGARNYDATHITSNERFAAAGVAITTPEEDDYIRPYFLDEDLNKLPSVQKWRSRTGRRLKAIRHASHTGFIIAANEDWDQLGRYGTSAIWQEATPYGIFYKCLHLAETYIDTNYAGLVDTVHRRFCLTARKAEQQFGRENLTPKMLEALLTPGKEHQEFEILHVVCPNTDYDADAWDHRRMPIASRYMAMEEKLYLRRKGYKTMPVSVSRNGTSPGEIYGRSPAINMAPTINGTNAMKLTTLRAAHKAVDPALLFNDDDGVTKLVSKAGGLNPGMVDDMGRSKVVRMPGGEQGVPLALDMIAAEQAQTKSAFLEDFYKILTDPNSRMTTTEVLEVMSKQGVLVRPFAGRYALEKQHPMSQRDMQLAFDAKQIEDLPPEAKEAGAWPLVAYENPMAAMARAESSAKVMRYVEYATVVSALAQTEAADTVDIDMALRKGAENIGIDPEIVRTAQQVQARREGRENAEAAVFNAEMVEKGAGAVKDFAQAQQIAGAA